MMFRALRRYYAIVYVALLYVPIAFIPFFSFNDSVYVAFPWRGFTLRWYEALAGSDGLLRALYHSLVVATASAVLATIVATLAAMATTRYAFMGKRILVAMLAAPLAVPTVVIAVSLLAFFSISGISLSLTTVVCGHFMICVPFSYGVLAARFEGLNPDLEYASADLGETPLWTFWRVTLPLVLPGIVSSLLLSFTISFDEFILAFFLSSNSPTLPVYMWSQMRFPDRLPMVLSLATLLLTVSAVLVTLSLRLRQTDPREISEATHG
jgi:spermidine/putrescine transport system permease protein